MDKILGKLRALRYRERIYGMHNPLTYDFLHHNLHHLHVLLFHSADQQDFTRGAIPRQLLVFMLPILLSQLLQHCRRGSRYRPRAVCSGAARLVETVPSPRHMETAL